MVAIVGKVLNQEGMDEADDADYQQLSDAMKQAALDLRLAVVNDDAEAARLAVGAIGQSCSVPRTIPLAQKKQLRSAGREIIMGIRFACHVCGKALNIKSDLAGKRGKCPACNVRFRIPQSDQAHSIPMEEEKDRAYDGGDEVDSEPEDAPVPVRDAPRVLETVIAAKDNFAPDDKPYTEIDDEFDPLSDPTAQWYVRPPNGGRYGPADGTTIRQWIREGRVTKTTLLWRDGWAQWRDTEEIIPEAFSMETDAAAGLLAHEPPARGKHNPPPDTVSPSKHPASQADATHPKEAPDPDTYLGAKKRRKSLQRTKLIGILAGIAIVLVIALVVALTWPR
jgi:hypothetical protein